MFVVVLRWVTVQKLDKSSVSGLITSFDENEFELMDAKKQTTKISWEELPPDTIMSDRVLLGPLRDNGGPTLTRAPEYGSAALDQGSNPMNLQYDQRGAGYPRTRGLPDIGAVERELPND